MIDLSSLTEGQIREYLCNIVAEHRDELCVNKDVVVERLINNPYVITLLDNKKLEENNATPDDYINVNIYKHLWMDKTQSKDLNLICYDIENIETNTYSTRMIGKALTFMIVIPKENLTTDYGCERQDLLSYIIRENFNWSNCLGLQIHLVSNRIQILENGYYMRILRFESDTTNSLFNGSTNKYD